MPLEKADITKLVAAGWKPPMPFTVKARDGKTDLYGLLFRPTNFDADEEVPDHQLRVSRAAERVSVGSARVRRGARRPPGAGRARLRRRHARRHGHAGPLEVVPRRLLRRDGPRQHAARPGGGHEGAGDALPVDRHRPGGDVGPLRRRLHHRRRDVPLSRLLQGRHLGIRQPRPARLRGRLGRALPGPAAPPRRRAPGRRRAARQLRGRGQPDAWPRT